MPYFPLEREHVAELTWRALEQRGAGLRARKGLELVWEEEVVEFLVGKVSLRGGECLAVGGFRACHPNESAIHQPNDASAIAMLPG